VEAASADVTRLASLGEEYFETKHRFDPFNATLLGLSEFDDLVPDVSRAASAEAAQTFRDLAAELAEIPEDGLTSAEATDRAVLGALLHAAADDAHHSTWAGNASAAGYGSRQGTLFQAAGAVTVSDDRSADRLLHRLSGLGGFFTGLAERYRQEAADGQLPTRIGVRHALGQLRTEMRATPTSSTLLRGFAAAPDSVSGDWSRRAVQERESTTLAAIGELAEVLGGELSAVARDDDHVGICFNRGGEQAYAAALRQHTTTTLTAPEIHELGLTVLGELDDRWAEIGRSALGETERTRIAERLRNDPGLRFETREEIVAVAQGALTAAEAALPRYFPTDVPIGPCDIVELTAEEAANSAMAYYRLPATDGTRNGAQCLATADPTSRYRYEYEALSFHESVPGHHLQLATSQLLDIPRYRRHLDVEVCGFNEGWGLYAEQLADELGLYSSDVARLGMLSFAALRACRLVVDTGMHHYGWSRERAVQFMWAHTATTRENVEHEIDRYISWPGQACAYMVGMRELVRLRSQARDALGDDFDLAGFHWAVISNGAVPLSVVGDAVARWQGERQARPWS
jgi:uncharacterized protein (DUF885 family)